MMRKKGGLAHPSHIDVAPNVYPAAIRVWFGEEPNLSSDNPGAPEAGASGPMIADHSGHVEA